MRYADTLLLGLDDEIVEGVAKLEALGEELVAAPPRSCGVHSRQLTLILRPWGG
jgi:hypothetical protein